MASCRKNGVNNKFKHGWNTWRTQGGPNISISEKKLELFEFTLKICSGMNE